MSSGYSDYSHSTHCDSISCLGCECTPECDYWDEEPNVLKERERIISLIEAEIDDKDKKRVSGGIDFDTRLELSQDIVLLRRISDLIKGENE